MVLRVSGGTSIAGPHLEDEGITVDFEEAIRLNVAGVGLSVFVGTEFERQTLLGLSELVNQGEKYGIPVLGITAVGKELEKKGLKVSWALLQDMRRTRGPHRQDLFTARILRK